MRTLAGLFVGGIATILAVKLLAAIFLPLVGLLLGLVGMALRLALFALVAYFVYRLLTSRRRAREV